MRDVLRHSVERWDAPLKLKRLSLYTLTVSAMLSQTHFKSHLDSVEQLYKVCVDDNP